MARKPKRAPAGPSRLHRRRTLDAHPDRVDFRDWAYQPTLEPLPATIDNRRNVPIVLNQGSEGACTGFALAGVVNYLIAQRRTRRTVSPRMLYELARKYDEWPGEQYDGSSARGAMKGWVAHGVCAAGLWPNSRKSAAHLSDRVAADAKLTPGGAYYRVSHRDVRQVHAAIKEVGAVYVTLMVHDGWDEPRPPGGGAKDRWTPDLPIITRAGHASDGHAVALVGYDRHGFIVLNSWGKAWGKGGFALLPYEDFMMHATDVWVAQIGVPITPTLLLGRSDREASAGTFRAAPVVPLADIRPFVIDLGNNGTLSDSGVYWTEPADIERLFGDTIPEKARSWPKRRVMLYLHGGLNSEPEVGKRVIAFKEVCLANQIYPVHIMWETGFGETLRSMIDDAFTDEDNRAGAVAEWMKKFRDGLTEAKDRGFELTVSRPGRRLWNEMKENGELASTLENGGMKIAAGAVLRNLKAVSAKDAASWELHIVAHSAGSIFAAHALDLLLTLGVPIKSVQFLAPAVTMATFKATVLVRIRQNVCPVPTLYILSDDRERDDNVAQVYSKSLLYLVSNAFEAARQTPLLGMERFIRPVNDDVAIDKDVADLYTIKGAAGPDLIISRSAKEGDFDPSSHVPSRSDSASHGGFDNDVATMNSVLWRILESNPTRAFTARDLAY